MVTDKLTHFVVGVTTQQQHTTEHFFKIPALKTNHSNISVTALNVRLYSAEKLELAQLQKRKKQDIDVVLQIS